jgi:tetratricopeptide (TPR) repeat protein
MRYLLILLLLIPFASAAQSEAGYLMEGEKWMKEGKTPQAIRAFENAIRLNPQSLAATLRLAEVYTSLQDFRNAVLYCNIALDITDNLERDFNEKKEKLERQGISGEPIDNWNLRLKRLDKERASIHQLKGLVRKYQGMKEEGLEEMRKGLALDEENVHLVIDVAVLSFDMGNAEEAEALFHRAIRLKPEHATPYLNLGHIWRLRVEPDSALHYYEKAMMRHPYTHWPYLYAADLLVQKQQWTKAISYYSKAIELLPEGDELYYKRALAWYAQENWQEAEKDWTMALDWDAENPDIYTNRGLCRLWQDNYTEAIMDFTAAITYQGGNTYAYAYRGYAYFLKKEHKLAMDDLNEIIRQQPTYAHGYYYRALVWQATGKKKKACQDIQKAHFMGLSFEKMDPGLVRLCTP